MVLLLTHIRDCGAIFDRDRVHWSIHTEVCFSTRFYVDYADGNWFKLDRIWIKTAKRSHLVQQERVIGWIPLEVLCLALPSRAPYQANEPLCCFEP